MPALPATVARPRQFFTFSFVDASGARRSVNIPFSGDADTVPGAPLEGLLGGLSNAAMVASSTTVGREVTPSNPAVVTFDETYSSVATILRLTFQNEEGNIVGVDVPAPDASILSPDRFTFNASANAGVINGILAVLNHVDGVNDDGTYTYRSGYLTSRSLRRGRPPELPSAIVEPGGGDQPGGGPG